MQITKPKTLDEILKPIRSILTQLEKFEETQLAAAETDMKESERLRQNAIAKRAEVEKSRAVFSRISGLTYGSQDNKNVEQLPQAAE